MSALVDFVSSGLAADLAGALLHTLWQGLLIGVVLYLLLKSKAFKGANARYLCAVGGLVLIVVCGLVTWAVLGYEPSVREEAAAVEGTLIAGGAVVDDQLCAAHARRKRAQTLLG